MFGTVLLVAVTVMEFYVFWRISSVPRVRRFLPPGPLAAIGAGLWILFYLARFVSHGSRSAAATGVEVAGMIWLGVLFITFVCVLAADLLTGFGFFFPRTAPRWRGAALLAGGALSVLALVQGLRPPEIVTYHIRLPGLSPELEGIKLAAIADTHLGTILGADWMKALVNRVERERPDAILLLGDILEGYGNDPEELIPVLRGLAAPLGVWSVPGNHESYGRETVTREILDGAGFNQLFNTHTEPLPGLVLAGIDYRREREGEENDERLVQALGGKPEGVAILLSHSPAPAEAAAGAGVDLMLSGHTHGGQIWPWSLLVKTRHPWLAGHYRVGSMQIIVSRGAGTWGPRMRLWQPGEVSIVVLHRADAGLETSTPDYSD